MWRYIYSCSIQYGYIQFTVCQFHFWFWVCHPTYLASPPASCHFRSCRYASSYGYMSHHLSHLWNPRTGLGQKPEVLQTHIKTTAFIGCGVPHVGYVLQKGHQHHAWRGEGQETRCSIHYTQSLKGPECHQGVWQCGSVGRLNIERNTVAEPGLVRWLDREGWAERPYKSINERVEAWIP